MSNQLVTYEEKRGLAAAFVKSKLFGVTDESQALALMALCEAEGLHPAKAIQEYHIIQGKPALKADAMLARFQRAGGSVNWISYTDEKVEGTFTHPQGGSITVEWTLARAQQAQIRNEMWKKYPRNMMRSRCISEGVRAIFPGISTGIYTVEEMQDMPAAQARDMGNVELVTPADPWTDELRASAKAAADLGMTSYTNWWKAQADTFRIAAVKTSTHADMKTVAAEKDTVEA